MALVVQNDDGDEAGANGYITLAYFKTYHTDRGNSYSAYTDPAINSAIIKATDYLDTRFQFRGILLTSAQTTLWPRSASSEPDADTFIALLGPSGEEITGIPEALKRACAEYALRALAAPLFQDAPAVEGGRLIDELTQKVDVIEQSIKYAPGQSGAYQLPAYPTADLLLIRAGLVLSGRTLVR